MFCYPCAYRNFGDPLQLDALQAAGVAGGDLDRAAMDFTIQESAPSFKLITQASMTSISGCMRMASGSINLY